MSVWRRSSDEEDFIRALEHPKCEDCDCDLEAHGSCPRVDTQEGEDDAD